MRKKLISHRGLLNGPNPALENSKKQIEFALAAGYDVEVDVRYINECWWIGHDSPEWCADESFIRTPGLWLHAKNPSALFKMLELRVNCFWHQDDNYTITSHGYIWAYPGKPTNASTVMVMPEWQDKTLQSCKTQICYGICTDYVINLDNIL